MLKKYFILSLLTVFTQLTVWSQTNFYAVDSLREIRISFYASDWDYQLDSLYVQGDNDRILADLIVDGRGLNLQGYENGFFYRRFLF